MVPLPEELARGAALFVEPLVAQPLAAVLKEELQLEGEQSLLAVQVLATILQRVQEV